MSKLNEARLRLRGELEAPPTLRRFGSGRIIGVLGLVLGLGGFVLLLALRMPGTFSIPETHGLCTNPWSRIGLHALLLAAFGLSGLSMAVRPGKTLGTCGVALTLLAALLDGSLDRLFGTHHLPEDQWSSGDGVQGHPVPPGYVAQFKHPFLRKESGE